MDKRNLKYLDDGMVGFVSDNELNNMLIAEFMGGQRVLSDYTGQQLKDVYTMPMYNNRRYELEELLYHESWDWLMPVIEEIDHLQRERIQSIEDALATRCVRDTYQAVVEFIKQYNNDN